MSMKAVPISHISPTCESCASLLAKCNAMQRRIQQLEEQIQRLTGFIQWQDALFATPSSEMSDAHKIIARVVPSIVAETKIVLPPDAIREDGLVQVDLKRIAKAIGKSEDRVGSNLAEMGKNGIIKHLSTRGYNKKLRRPIGGVYIDTTPSLLKAEISIEEKRNRGNKQKYFICRSCLSTNTRVRKLYEVICKDCGEVHHYDPTSLEDRVFMNVDEITVETWTELYGNSLEGVEPSVPLEPIEPAPTHPCFVCSAENWIWNPLSHNWECGNQEGHRNENNPGR